MEPRDRLKTVAIGAVSAAKTAGSQAGEQPTVTVVDPTTVEAIIAGWPAMSRQGANEIIGKYGPVLCEKSVRGFPPLGEGSGQWILTIYR